MLKLTCCGSITCSFQTGQPDLGSVLDHLLVVSYGIDYKSPLLLVLIVQYVML